MVYPKDGPAFPLRSETTKPPKTWGLEVGRGYTFTFNREEICSVGKGGAISTMFVSTSKAELAKELREFALAANEAATFLEHS